MHLYKLGDTYYMMVIQGPKGIRTQLCFRSKQIEGPYEMQVVLSDDLRLCTPRRSAGV